MIFILSRSARHSHQIAEEAHLSPKQYRHGDREEQIRGFRGPEHELWICRCANLGVASDMYREAHLQEFTIKDLS